MAGADEAGRSCAGLGREADAALMHATVCVALHDFFEEAEVVRLMESGGEPGDGGVGDDDALAAEPGETAEPFGEGVCRPAASRGPG